ncbi:mitochondrial intermediate peptidase [Schizopora paradoxa]|uniref:Mitochondrial intermediate peptidase n=1 Tax=Schizopora paradoxa TaxID=27342 RepID=A0A0H2SU42_9AGAM|nr:mitochondrial intermediate peptidase [Schizopora paradoxa]
MLARTAARSLRHSRRLVQHIISTKSPKHISYPRTTRHAATTAIPASSEDTELIPFFDQPSTSRSWLSPNAGLFLHKDLVKPSSLTTLANGTLRRAQFLTDRILRARESRDELHMVLKNLDKLSDLLCGVIDLAELIRNSHPESAWVRSANDAYDTLCEFMNVLNTHVGLYEVLESVFADPIVLKSLSQEAYYTALVFWRDFEKSAINLPEQQRRQFVTLSSEIIGLGRKFLDNASALRPPAYIMPSELEGLKDMGMGTRLSLQAHFTNRPLLVYPGSLQAQMIMRSAPSEEPRHKLYLAANSGTRDQIDILEQMLRRRAELAKLCGKDSYAELTLNDKMVKSPDHVRYFLDALLDRTRPYARSALHALSQRKQIHQGLSSLPVIQAWDRDYYCPPEPPLPPIPLPPLTPGTVFMALSRLFKHLYGITLRPVDMGSGEVWHHDIRKLEVVDESLGVIGLIYADLFARRGKASGAAHYTVRCSRRTDDDDPQSDYIPAEYVDESVRMSQRFEQEGRSRLRGQSAEFQLPVVVLLCEFTPPSATSGAAPLEWHEVQTLFHEMGHAMHSMIGRTEYHNVSGTRCATDFVELPSILMEHFLSSPSVLSLFTPNHDPSALSRAGNHHQDPCHAIDTHGQILLACLDQEYHSSKVLDPAFDTSRVYAELQERRGLIPPVEGTAWQTQFGHLYGYGATYYSYLFDRAIASKVWSQLFSVDPLSRETGEKYKDEVLKFGGAKDPWLMVSKLLATPELENGDAEAMREVGQWRIEDEISAGRH